MVFKNIVNRVAFIGSKSLLESIKCGRILLKRIWVVFLVFFKHDVSHFDQGVKLTRDLKRILSVEYLVLRVLFF